MDVVDSKLVDHRDHSSVELRAIRLFLVQYSSADVPHKLLYFLDTVALCENLFVRVNMHGCSRGRCYHSTLWYGSIAWTDQSHHNPTSSCDRALSLEFL